MAYNESAANRVRKLLKRRKGFAERKMFGGIAFLLNGNMCCGVVDDDLVLRLGPELAAEALDKPHTREMDFTGKSLKSMVYLAPAGYKTEAALGRWVRQVAQFTASLPPK
jgi:TfoX/Sxy family transcriptional regulator of competence genes